MGGFLTKVSVIFGHSLSGIKEHCPAQEKFASNVSEINLGCMFRMVVLGPQKTGWT